MCYDPLRFSLSFLICSHSCITLRIKKTLEVVTKDQRCQRSYHRDKWLAVVSAESNLCATTHHSFITFRFKIIGGYNQKRSVKLWSFLAFGSACSHFTSTYFETLGVVSLQLAVELPARIEKDWRFPREQGSGTCSPHCVRSCKVWLGARDRSTLLQSLAGCEGKSGASSRGNSSSNSVY